MKRFLNKLPKYTVILAKSQSIIGPSTSENYIYTQRFILDPNDISANNLKDNEMFIGIYNNNNRILFRFNKVSDTKNEIFSLSHDDYSYDHMFKELKELDNRFNRIEIPENEITIPSDVGDK